MSTEDIRKYINLMEGVEGNIVNDSLPSGVERDLRVFIRELKQEIEIDPTFIEYIEPIPEGERFDSFVTATDRFLDIVYDEVLCPKLNAILWGVRSANDDSEYDWESRYPNIMVNITNRFCELWNASKGKSNKK